MCNPVQCGVQRGWDQWCGISEHDIGGPIIVFVWSGTRGGRCVCWSSLSSSNSYLAKSANNKNNSTVDVADNNAAVITMKRHEETEKAEPTIMSISYPIEPLTWRKSVFVHPYFAFQSPDDEGSYFEWQMHPVPHGRLRYTLVRVPRVKPSGSPAQPGIPSDDSILAIYHHIGDGVSLPLPSSEGVLLLSDMNLTTELMVVASVFGMLEQLRRLSKTGKGIEATKKSGLGLVKGLLNRK